MKNISYFNRYFKNLLFFIPLVTVLSGCASVVSYEEPKSGPTARVRFVSDSANTITSVKEYDSVDCDNEKEMMRLRKGFLFRSDPRSLGMPLNNYHKNAAKEFLVTAGIPHIYMFKHTNISTEASYMVHRSYGVILRQKFEKDKDYEVSYKANAHHSYVEVNEIKVDKGGVAEKFFIQQASARLYGDFSKSCLDVFKNERFW